MDLLYRALDILEYVCISGSTNVDELSESLKIPKSTVYRLLRSLEKRDYVRHTSPNCYEAGPRLLMLQGTLERQNRLLQAARPHLRELNEKTGQTVHLAIPSASNVSYVDTVVGRTGISLAPSPSSPLHCTSLGKAILAFMPPQAQEAMIKQCPLEQRTPNTITSVAALRKELEQVRRLGYSQDNEEFELGLRCIGAPVRNATQEVIAAVSISGLAVKFTRDVVPSWSKAVRDTALAISIDLGYTVPQGGQK
jgi:DNA-binding IclR family transcriptional regulator